MATNDYYCPPPHRRRSFAWSVSCCAAAGSRRTAPSALNLLSAEFPFWGDAPPTPAIITATPAAHSADADADATTAIASPRAAFPGSIVIAHTPRLLRFSSFDGVTFTGFLLGRLVLGLFRFRLRAARRRVILHPARRPHIRSAPEPSAFPAWKTGSGSMAGGFFTNGNALSSGGKHLVDLCHFSGGRTSPALVI